MDLYRGELLTGKDRQQALDGEPYGSAMVVSMMSPWYSGTTWQDIIDLEASQWAEVSPPSTPSSVKS